MSDTPDPALLAAVRLNLVPGIGPRTQMVLVGTFGSPAAVFGAGERELRSVSGVGPKIVRAIRDSDPGGAARELARAAELGVTVLRLGGPGYPGLLADIAHAPRVLYVRGELRPEDAVAVAMVGSRRCSPYGIRQAERFAGGLARAGVTVVSGLALGIDGAAHRAALAVGGRTLAVCATGMETVYPPQHRDLADEVAASGAIVTEFPLGQQPTRGLFPQRNRVISGLSLGTILVEAARRSGALHTVRHAIEQNRDVFAVPGRLGEAACEANLDVLRDGAQLIRGVDDVLESLGPLAFPAKVALTGRHPQLSPASTPQADDSSSDRRRGVGSGGGDERGGRTREIRNPRELTLTEQERAILDLVPTEPGNVDNVLAAADLDAGRVLSTLTMLEMKRLVRRLPGNGVVRA